MRRHDYEFGRVPLKAAGVALESVDGIRAEFGIANVEDGGIDTKEVPIA